MLCGKDTKHKLFWIGNDKGNGSVDRDMGGECPGRLAHLL